MKHKEVLMRLAALGLSTVVLWSSPAIAFATEPTAEYVAEKQKENGSKVKKLELEKNAESEKEARNSTRSTYEADENGFVIEDGVLVDYQGDAETVVILESVTTIGNEAFWGCSHLTNIVIPNSVTTIGNSAFWGCSRLTEITIPDSITTIESQAFFRCTALTEIEIPNSVTKIGIRAFAESENLEKIVIPESVTKIESDAFFQTKWLENKRLENPLVIVNSILIDATTATGTVTIPSNITQIGDSAFDCSEVTEIVISENVTQIGSSAFYGCDNLKQITIPGSVSEVPDFAFSYCLNLEEVILLEGVCQRVF